LGCFKSKSHLNPELGSTEEERSRNKGLELLCGK